MIYLFAWEIVAYIVDGKEHMHETKKQRKDGLGYAQHK